MSMVPYEVSQGLQSLSKVAEEFLLEIVAPPARELGQLITDQVRFFRWKNQIRILVSARDKLSAARIKPGKVGLKLLLPLLEGGSLEEDDSMIDRWANLLANAANPAHSKDIKIGYIEILRQLSPIDALILDKFYDFYDTAETPKELDGAQLRATSSVERKDFERAMDNLFRLDLLATAGALLVNPQVGEEFYSLPGNIRIQFTRFGYDFVAACRTKNK